MGKSRNILMSHRYLDHLIKSFNGIIYRLDIPSRKILSISGSVSKATGYTNRQLLSGEIQWKELIHPEDLFIIESEIQRLLKNRDYISDTVYRVKRKDGSYAWVNDIGILLDPDSEKPFIQALLLDISRYRDAEKELKNIDSDRSLILNLLPEMIYLIDTEYRILWANNVTAESVWKKSSDLFGSLCYRILFDRKTPCEFCPAKKAFTGGKLEPAVYQAKNGRYFCLYSNPFYDDEKRVAGAVLVSHDITREITSAKKIKETGRILEESLEASDIGLWTIDVQGNHVNFSSSFYKMLGYKRMKNSLQGILNHIYREDKDVFIKFMNQLFSSCKGQKSLETEIRFLTRDKKQKHLLLRGIVLERDRSRKPLRVIASLVDITEMKTGQSYLNLIHEIAVNLPKHETLEESFDYLLDKLMEIEGIDCGGAYIIDQETMRPALISSKGLKGRFTETVRDKGDNLEEYGKTPAFSLFNKQRSLQEKNSGRYSGKSPFTAVAVIPIINSGRKIAVINVASRSLKQFPGKIRNLLESISAQIAGIINSLLMNKTLERSVSTLKATIESTGDGVIVVDHYGNINIFNQNLAEMWQIPDYILKSRSIKQITGHIAEMVEDRNEFINRIESIKSGMQNRSYDIIELKDGRVIERYSQPHFMEGKIIGRVWNYRDITDRKRIEREQEALKNQLAHSQKMESLGRLSASIAHDLNNMLVPILGYSELLLAKHRDSEDLSKCLNVIFDAALRAKGLTKKLLTLGKKQNPDMRSININDIISSFFPIIKKSIGNNIGIDFDLGVGLPPIKADIAQLEHVLLNLLINSRDAIDKKGTIKIKTCMADDRSISLIIIDNGHGIDAEIRERLFEPFFTTKKSGSGLGLTIVYNIVQQHKGHISVNSTPEKGTVFTINFPITDEPAEKAVTTDSESVEDLTGTETILLVDDNNNTRILVDQILNEYKYKVIQASRATEAIKISENYEGRIDLLFTDYLIPDMNGRDLYHRIKESRPDIRVMYMSGYNPDTIPYHHRTEITQNFLQKPFSVVSAVEKLREILSR